jgi:Ca2+-binding EF-hand superfamily protein
MDAYFDLVDEDGDGFINYDELSRVAEELGRDCMSDKAFLALTEKLSEDGTKFNKIECLEILKKYL